MPTTVLARARASMMKPFSQLLLFWPMGKCEAAKCRVWPLCQPSLEQSLKLMVWANSHRQTFTAKSSLNQGASNSASYTLIEAIISGFSGGIGFLIAIVLFAGIAGFISKMKNKEAESK